MEPLYDIFIEPLYDDFDFATTSAKESFEVKGSNL